MNIEIYYFSGTGNSFAVAREISEKTNGKLIPIPTVMNHDHITTNADVIGIIFPVYYTGIINIPLIVQRFVMKLENINKPYIFAVCTYGGGFGTTLKLLDKMINSRGGRLSSGFGVHMPQNAFTKPFENKEKLYQDWKKEKLATICECVLAKQEYKFDTDSILIKPVVNILERIMKTAIFKPIFLKSMSNTAGFKKNPNLPAEEIIHLMDNSYHTDENCKNCTTCAKICPVHNIKLVEGKPVWQHHCETCLACIKWCPQNAIHGYGEFPKSYHHPDVMISDMQQNK
ncbi:EFR1 family ferrodoxin [Methanobacterium sp. SMA-27]|uniref:EFR1 family ferrodoxin n=1 Tax=Methanobacterium sp. SMA-27 TaxID=1495336 RepID=UPI00064FF8C9|nr:EFR1 family ferrodoxin [Methanobacterium sp. SMA-27]